MKQDDSIKNKGIHVKLERQTHVGFKTRLIEFDVSMQAAFEEFAQLVADGNPSAINIVARLKTRNIKANLKQVGLTYKGSVRHKPKPLDELDSEVLYDLISENEVNESDDL